MTKIWAVNAFATHPFKGNPAGVCIVDDFSNAQRMQEIAKDLGFSNTAFIQKITAQNYNVKWYTPHSEAPICGHATIAATHVLISEQLENASRITYQSAVGEITCTKNGEWFKLNFPQYNPVAKAIDLAKITPLKPSFIGVGENCIFAEFTEAELLELTPNLDELAKLEFRALIATARSTKYDFGSRYFAPKVGIPEDPVCASAHCRLIPYWAEKLGKDEMVAYQASARGGVIKCQNIPNRVLISGEAVTVYSGNVNDGNLKELKNVA
ncbi:MAG: PhzF family phenazine biosynthesis protein [Rickettsiales bacterium]